MGTSELLVGLIDAGEKVKSRRVRESINYVEKKIMRDEITNSTRSVAWSSNLLILAGRSKEDPHLRKLVSKLILYRLEDQGWPRMEGEREANVFDSALALRTLLSYGHPPSHQLRRSVEWIVKAQNRDGGWGFHPGDESNPACTAQCMITLMGKTRSVIIDRGSRFLLQSALDKGGWEGIYEQVGPELGGKYFHYTNPWGIMALLAAGVDIKNNELQDAVESLIESQWAEGYWKILPDTHSIPSTGNALMALSHVSKLLSSPASQ